MEFTGERFIPGQGSMDLQIEHFNRYQFARQFVAGKRVLDAACGVGYGSDFLARDADFVAGIDISKESIAYAKEKYTGANTEFQTGSIDNLPYDDASFDVVVSFETLEYVSENMQKDFIREIKRVLTKDGILVISTPNRSVDGERGADEFHIKELEYAKFREMLEETFEFVQLFNQQFEICNIIGDSKSIDSSAWMESRIPANEAKYLIAVCSNRAINNIVGRVIVRDDKMLDGLIDWAQANHTMSEELSLELAGIKSSRSWRIMNHVWKIRDIIVPKGSRRRLFVKTVVRFIKHPIQFLSKRTPTDKRTDVCEPPHEVQRQEVQIEQTANETSMTLAEHCDLREDRPMRSAIGEKLRKDRGAIIEICSTSSMTVRRNSITEGYFKDYRDLDSIGLKFGTDKNSNLCHYLNKYDFFLSKFRDRKMNVLELGVFKGASIAMWEEYFPNAIIYGVDVNADCKVYEAGRKRIIIEDLSREEQIRKLADIGPEIIIDDASHLWSHQIMALYELLPSLPSGGIYILEDIGTSFGDFVAHYGDTSISAYDFLSVISEVVTSGHTPRFGRLSYDFYLLKDEIEYLASQIEMMSFIMASCVIIKK